MDNDMKKSWRDMKVCRESGDDYGDIFSGRRRTALQRLARRYRHFSNLALMMLVFCPYWMMNPMLPERNRLWVGVLMGVFFLTVSVMDRWLYHGISGIDCGSMTVSEVTRLAVFYRKRHLQFILILLPMALLWVGAFTWLLSDNFYAVCGVVCGLLIGTAVGLRKFFDFMADYREARSE